MSRVKIASHSFLIQNFHEFFNLLLRQKEFALRAPQGNDPQQLAKQTERYVCSCGKERTIGKKARHERSKFHQAFICASAGNGEASISVPTNPGKNLTETPEA